MRTTSLFASFGIANLEETENNFKAVYSLADNRMYENKTQYYVSNHIDRRGDSRINN